MNNTGFDIDIRIGDFTVCYDDLGIGTIPLIFIHGFPFNKSMWKPQMDELSETNRVIAFDIRGFGKSGAGKEKPTIQLFADDLIRFMDALEIKKAVVCGLSMGGYILLDAVDRYANRFEAIILSDTQCIADSHEVKERRYKSIDQLNKGGLKEYAENYVTAMFNPETKTNRPDEIEKMKNIILNTSVQSLVKTIEALANRRETCFVLPGIRVPTLIICGRQDMVTPVTQAEHLYEFIPHSTLYTIDKAGHLSNIEQPELFNKYISDFVAKL